MEKIKTIEARENRMLERFNDHASRYRKLSQLVEKSDAPVVKILANIRIKRCLQVMINLVRIDFPASAIEKRTLIRGLSHLKSNSPFSSPREAINTLTALGCDEIYLASSMDDIEVHAHIPGEESSIYIQHTIKQSIYNRVFSHIPTTTTGLPSEM